MHRWAQPAATAKVAAGPHASSEQAQPPRGTAMSASAWLATPIAWQGGQPPDPNESEPMPEEAARAPAAQQEASMPVLLDGPGPQGIPRPRSFQEWLSTSLRDAAHHYKAALTTLARQNHADASRVAAAWNVLVHRMRMLGRDCTMGLAQVMHSEVLAPLTGASPGGGGGGGGGGPIPMPLVPVGPIRPENGGAVYPFGMSTVLKRLLADQDACYYFGRMVNGTDEFMCNNRMAETFVTTTQLQAVHQQFGGLLSGYLWCTFVVPEDRPVLMRALASIAYEKGSRVQVDCIIRCINRAGEQVRCLASVGFCVEEEAGDCIVVLRLWPLIARGLSLPRPGAKGSSNGSINSSSVNGNNRSSGMRRKRSWDGHPLVGPASASASVGSGSSGSGSHSSSSSGGGGNGPSGPTGGGNGYQQQQQQQQQHWAGGLAQVWPFSASLSSSMSLASVPEASEAAPVAAAGEPPRRRGRAEGSRATMPGGEEPMAAPLEPLPVSPVPLRSMERGRDNGMGKYFVYAHREEEEDEEEEEQATHPQPQLQPQLQHHQQPGLHFHQYWDPLPPASGEGGQHAHAQPHQMPQPPPAPDPPPQQRYHRHAVGAAMTSAAPLHGDGVLKEGEGEGDDAGALGGAQEAAPPDLQLDMWDLLSDSLVSPLGGGRRGDAEAGEGGDGQG